MTHRMLCSTLALAACAAAVGIPLAISSAAAPATPKAPSSAPAARTGDQVPASHKKTVQMRGFSMQLNDPKATASYLRAIDELADMGCTWINIAIAGRQYDIRSSAVTLDLEKVPSMPEVLKIIQKAKSRGMGVMMMPMVLLIHTGSKDWRGIIQPDDGEKGWDRWFENYRIFITNMADLAQRGDVDIFVVGSELLSTEPSRERWVETISQIKNGRKDPRDPTTLLTRGYKGKLTYSANWDHYTHVTFWDQLDYVGMNNYNELGTTGTSVEQLNKNWVKVKDDVLKFAAEQKKPFMFTEVGWHNLDNTLKEPWNYVAQGKIDHNEQLHAFQSFVQTWQPVPRDQFMGAFIWEWCPDGKVTDHGTYSLQETPSLDVVKKWFIAP